MVSSSASASVGSGNGFQSVQCVPCWRISATRTGLATVRARHLQCGDEACARCCARRGPWLRVSPCTSPRIPNAPLTRCTCTQCLIHRVDFMHRSERRQVPKAAVSRCSNTSVQKPDLLDHDRRQAQALCRLGAGVARRFTACTCSRPGSEPKEDEAVAGVMPRDPNKHRRRIGWGACSRGQPAMQPSLLRQGPQ